MGDDSLIGIVFFAVIAAILAHRLWQVLGRRDDSSPPEGRPDPFRVRDPQNLSLPQNRTVTQPQTAPPVPGSDPVSLEAWLRAIRNADPRFDERQFLAGARAAFEMIITAFSTGDRPTLRRLLSDDVFRSFEQTIDAREKEGQTLETSITKTGADIEEARLAGSVARISVTFRSGQISVLKAADGSVMEGDPKRVEDVLDLWVFARDTRSADPNWSLVETRSIG